jgi:hypothetical protein
MLVGYLLMSAKYPVYVISKNRWETRKTSRCLEKMKVPYRIVVEPQECDQYSAVIDPAKILVLPFSNLGQGSIPARNWVWEHSISEGHGRHWILDDNIREFGRMYQNTLVPTYSISFFKAMEDFIDRFKNVAMAGPQYHTFARSNTKVAPFVLNTRVYSCILIDNALKHRWRGRYNEDTDLSLRVLKDGWCTVLFYAFVQDKQTTMTMKGGNTDELYADDGRLKMAQSLQQQHPDVVSITRKWGRWQHSVDYRPFKANKLVKRDDIDIPQGVNNYGMKLVKLDD